MAVQNPLTADDLVSIKKALEDAKDAKELISMAEQAGIDVAAFKIRADETQQRLLRVKQAFFPGQ